MAKRKQPAKDTRQQIFQFFEEFAEVLSLAGGNQENLSEFDFRFRQSLKASLEEVSTRDQEPLDRIEIAARMSRVLGREITKTKIDQWTAMSSIQHRMNVDALKGYCEVTGDYKPFHVFVEACGFKALSPTEAVCAEYGAQMLAKKAIETDMRNTLSAVDEDELRKILNKRMKR